MEVVLDPGAAAELEALRHQSVPEYTAMLRAIAKLQAFGAHLGDPHTSQVRGASVRELRPRAGRSAWRAFHRRVGDAIVIASIGPEANVDRRGFDAAVARAETRLEADAG